MSAPVGVLSIFTNARVVLGNSCDASLLLNTINLDEAMRYLNRFDSAQSAVSELIEAAKKAESFISIAVPSLAADRNEALTDILPALRAALNRACGAA